jgi:hypothetical protein
MDETSEKQGSGRNNPRSRLFVSIFGVDGMDFRRNDLRPTLFEFRWPRSTWGAALITTDKFIRLITEIFTIRKVDRRGIDAIHKLFNTLYVLRERLYLCKNKPSKKN